MNKSSTRKLEFYCGPTMEILKKTCLLVQPLKHEGRCRKRCIEFSCLRLRQWPVTYLITLSDWIMSCQPGHHAVVTVCEPDWKHKWAAYKSFDETSSFNNL